LSGTQGQGMLERLLRVRAQVEGSVPLDWLAVLATAARVAVYRVPLYRRCARVQSIEGGAHLLARALSESGFVPLRPDAASLRFAYGLTLLDGARTLTLL